MAEREGFEPSVPCGTIDFESNHPRPLGHLSMYSVEEHLILYHKTYKSKHIKFELFAGNEHSSLDYTLLSAGVWKRLLKQPYLCYN